MRTHESETDSVRPLLLLLRNTTTVAASSCQSVWSPKFYCPPWYLPAQQFLNSRPRFHSMDLQARDLCSKQFDYESAVDQQDCPLLGHSSQQKERVQSPLYSMCWEFLRAPHPLISFGVLSLSLIILFTGFIPFLDLDKSCTKAMYGWSEILLSLTSWIIY